MLIVTTALMAAMMAAAPSTPGEGPAFSLRVVSPRPLYLAGRCRLLVEAIDASGDPFDAIAFMTLSVDGGDPRHDGRAPFAWDIDAGDDFASHRIEVTAVARDGSRASLSTVSFDRPFVEAVGVNLVLVPVVVREQPPGGRPAVVRGLSREDFTLLEDGRPQPIASFSDEPLPASIAVALDNSRSMEGQLWSARKAVMEFIDQQPSYSAVSLLTFNDQVFLERDFTYDRSQLEQAAAAIRVEGARTALNEAVRTGARHLSRRRGARVLVVFTDGEDTLDEDAGGDLRTAIDAAQAADVTVFAIAYGPAAAAAGAKAESGDALAAMTAETGGMVLPARGAGDLREAFGRLAESLGGRYVLGFEPPDPEKPGYRSIEVRVSRTGVQVLARRGYTMRPGAASPAAD